MAASPASTFRLNPDARVFTPSCNRYSHPSCLSATTTMQTAIAASTSGLGKGGLCSSPDLGLRESIDNCTVPSPMASAAASSPLASSSIASRRTTARRNRKNETPFDGCVVVIKNLPINVTEQAVVEWLVECGASSTCVTLHIDARTGFRGTVFVRYDNKELAQAALGTLGSTRDFAGRRAKVELQRKGRDKATGGAEQELTEDEIKAVQKLVDDFVAADEVAETLLPQCFTVKMRKYAHSLAEKRGLVHVTTGETTPTAGPPTKVVEESPRGSPEGKQVYLSKNRPTPGEGKRRTKDRPLSGAWSPVTAPGGSTTDLQRQAFVTTSAPLFPIPPPNTPAHVADGGYFMDMAQPMQRFDNAASLHTSRYSPIHNELHGTRWHMHAISPQHRGRGDAGNTFSNRQSPPRQQNNFRNPPYATLEVPAHLRFREPREARYQGPSGLREMELDNWRQHNYSNGSKTSPGNVAAPDVRFGRGPTSPSTARHYVKPPPGFEDLHQEVTNDIPLPPPPNQTVLNQVLVDPPVAHRRCLSEERGLSDEAAQPTPLGSPHRSLTTSLIGLDTSKLPLGIAGLALMGPVAKAGALVAARSMLTRPPPISSQRGDLSKDEVPSPLTSSTVTGSPFAQAPPRRENLNELVS